MSLVIRTRNITKVERGNPACSLWMGLKSLPSTCNMKLKPPPWRMKSHPNKVYIHTCEHTHTRAHTRPHTHTHIPVNNRHHECIWTYFLELPLSVFNGQLSNRPQTSAGYFSWITHYFSYRPILYHCNNFWHVKF